MGEALVPMAPRESCPDVDVLHELLEMDPKTGDLKWRRRSADWFEMAVNPEMSRKAWNARFAGKPAMQCISACGFFCGNLLGEHYATHRIVWAMHFGEWPPRALRHKNDDLLDNRPENLVLCREYEPPGLQVGDKFTATCGGNSPETRPFTVTEVRKRGDRLCRTFYDKNKDVPAWWDEEPGWSRKYLRVRFIRDFSGLITGVDEKYRVWTLDG